MMKRRRRGEEGGFSRKFAIGTACTRDDRAEAV